MDQWEWIVRGAEVGLSSTTKERWIERWTRYKDDPFLAMLERMAMPPTTVERLHEVYGRIAAGEWMVFEIRLLDGERCVGEATLSKLQWPFVAEAGTARIGMTIFEAEDRGKGFGTEAGELLVAYAFDALGLHRLSIDFLALNEGVHKIGEKMGGKVIGRAREAAWVFGKYHDAILMDLLRDEVPPHPATAHLRAAP